MNDDSVSKDGKAKVWQGHGCLCWICNTIGEVRPDGFFKKRKSTAKGKSGETSVQKVVKGGRLN